MIRANVEGLGLSLHFCLKEKNADLASNLVKNSILFRSAKTVSYSNYNFDYQLERTLREQLDLFLGQSLYETQGF